MVRQATIEDLTIFDTYSLNHGKLTKFGVTCNVETYWSSSKGKQWNQHGDNPVAEPMEALQHDYLTVPCPSTSAWHIHDGLTMISQLLFHPVTRPAMPCYALGPQRFEDFWGRSSQALTPSVAPGIGCFMMKRMSYECVRGPIYGTHLF